MASAPRERRPGNACATRLAAIGCCTLAPMPPMTSAPINRANPALAPAIRNPTPAKAVPMPSNSGPPIRSASAPAGTWNPAIDPV